MAEPDYSPIVSSQTIFTVMMADNGIYVDGESMVLDNVHSDRKSMCRVKNLTNFLFISVSGESFLQFVIFHPINVQL